MTGRAGVGGAVKVTKSVLIGAVVGGGAGLVVAWVGAGGLVVVGWVTFSCKYSAACLVTIKARSSGGMVITEQHIVVSNSLTMQA